MTMHEMKGTRPIPLTRIPRGLHVYGDLAVACDRRITRLLSFRSSINSSRVIGGLTVWLEGSKRPRALFYRGPLDIGVDQEVRTRLRKMLGNGSICVSVVRRSDERTWETATAEDPHGYL